MIAEDKTNQCLADHAEWLNIRTSTWHLPAGADVEDIIAESLEALWWAESIEKKVIRQPKKWLLSAAGRKKMERARWAAKCRTVDFQSGHSELVLPIDRESDLETRVDEALKKSKIWQSLKDVQRYVVVQCVMLDRSPAAVGREVGVQRQTVNGWAKRIPQRLATDPAFLKFLNTWK